MGKRDKQYCIGCNNALYNSNNECWAFAHAKVVTRYRVGWYTSQDLKKHFVKVTTHDCHKETGTYAFYNRLPSNLK